MTTPLSEKAGYVGCAHTVCMQIFIGKKGDLCSDCQDEDPNHDTDSCGLCDNDCDV